MVELLAPRPDESILDLGCGTGELASVVAATGASVVGIEADEAMIAKARRDHPGVRFEVADGHRFEVTEPFDAVMSNAALQWMRDPDAVIARVHAARLEAGGFRVRSLELIDRPTPLGPDGLAGWLRMFGGRILAAERLG